MSLMMPVLAEMNGCKNQFMLINKITQTPVRADESAMGAIHRPSRHMSRCPNEIVNVHKQRFSKFRIYSLYAE